MEREIKVPPFVDKWIKENKLTRWWDVIARWEKAEAHKLTDLLNSKLDTKFEVIEVEFE